MANRILNTIPAARPPLPAPSPKARKKCTKTHQNTPGNHPVTHISSTRWKAFSAKNTPLPPPGCLPPQKRARNPISNSRGRYEFVEFAVSGLPNSTVFVFSPVRKLNVGSSPSVAPRSIV